MNWALDDRYPVMPWQEIDNVVFDVGNVLLNFHPKEILAELFPEQPELQAVLYRKCMLSPYWIAMDEGIMTPEEIVQAMTGLDRELEPQVRRVMTGWMDLKEVNEEGVAVLRKSREMGKKVYVLSNYGREAFAFMERKYDFMNLFDGKVVSAHVHQLKPGAEIFNTLRDTCGLDPARSLFIDDSYMNIEAALREGWQGICFNAPGKLRRFFGLD